MDYVVLVGTCVAALHAFTYGQWLKSNNNRVGAVGVFLLAVGGVVLSLYRVLFAR